MARGIIIVLDSLGIGGAPDAEKYGDIKANTLENILKFCEKELLKNKRNSFLKIPNLINLGLLDALCYSKDVNSHIDSRKSSFCVARSNSVGKDTVSGHWELAGVPTKKNWHYFPKTFPSIPQKLLDSVITKFSIDGFIGNYNSSGVEIINLL